MVAKTMRVSELSPDGFGLLDATAIVGARKFDLACLRDMSRSGVYFLIRGQRVVYVGKAKNILSRLASHFLEHEKRFDSVVYVSVRPSWLDRAERSLIRIFSPELNRSMPPVSEDDMRWVFKTFMGGGISLQRASLCGEVVTVSE